MTHWPESGRLCAAGVVALGQLVGGCAAAGGPEEKPAPAPEPVWPAFTVTLGEQDGPVRVQRESIGPSAGGVEIPLYQLWVPGDAPPGERPAVLVIAGIDARHEVGHEVARDLIGALRLAEPAVLAQTTLYIVPMLNPDAQQRSGPLDAAVPGGTLTARDADRDGRIDEDGPADLNGDGLITMMRVEDPPPGWGLQATKIIDPDEPRLMRDPDPAAGERATHAVLVEGRDIDGDGRIAEDGAGGVDLDRNFPYLWPEGAADAGAWALSEPESRAIVDWMLERPNIYAVVAYEPDDTIVNIPQAGKFDQTGRVPTGIETADKTAYERVSKLFKEITGQTGAPSGDNQGSLQGWAYAHFGVLSFSTPVWVRPDLVRSGEAEPSSEQPATGAGAQPEAPGAAPETITLAGRTITLTVEGVQAAQAEMETLSEAEQQAVFAAFSALPAETQAKLQALMQGQEIGAAPPEQDKPAPKKRSDSDEGKWLTYLDEQRDGAGFVDWATIDHPDLGPVEVGGFAAGFQFDAPDDTIPDLVAQQAEFITKLLDMSPKLVIEEPVVESLGAGLWRVSIRLRNDGQLATRSAMGVKARRLPPIVVHIDADDEALFSGSRIERINAIDPHGSTSDHEWIVRRAPGSELLLTVRTSEWGNVTRTIRFQEGE